MNKRKSTIAFLWVAMIWLGGCAAPSVPQNVKKVADYSYSDDPSKYRPKVEVPDITASEEPQVIQNEAIVGEYNIDEQLGAIVDSMYVRNDSIRQFNGFTILVYSGNNEIEAGKVRNRLFDLLPGQEARFTYKLPTYFVEIGQYFQQLEAAPTLKMIQETYPSAAIVPEKFPIINDDESGEN